MSSTTVGLAPFLEDASGYRGTADRLCAPATTDELRTIVEACSRSETPVTIAGAGTGLTGARVPHGGAVISLERFRRIDVQSGRAICGAAVSLADLAAAAAKTKQFLGPNPTESSASIGGVISTNAGGARSFHYGALRHHVLALEVTFMDGRTVRLRRGEPLDFPITPVPQPATTKNAAGYFLVPDVDWIGVLAGSEGTLGIVTEAELALQNEPAAILSGVIFFSTDEDALAAIEAWRTVPELRLLEYMDRPALTLLRPSYPDIPESAQAALLIEQNLSSEEDEQVGLWEERLSAVSALDSVSWFGFTAAERERFRRFRHTLPANVVDRARRSGYPKFGTDFAVPLARHRDLHAFYRRRCEEEFPGRYTIFGHAGDANNHVNLLPETQDEAQRAEDIIEEFARFVVSLGGTVAAEHGVGKTKTNLLKLMYNESQIDSMRAVKRHFDPQWLLGQGTIFSEHAE